METAIVDANNLCYRIYYKYPQLTAFGGDTSIIFGVIKEIARIKKEYNPTYLIFAWDSKKSMRKRDNKEYKANRKEKDPSFLTVYRQIDILHKKVLSTLSVNSYKLDFYEGDDIIGFLCNDKKIKKPICIFSGDTDFFQLLDNDILINNWKNNIDEKYFKKQFGFPSYYYPIFKSLTGDKSDNVKGVAGIGPKKATELMKKGNFDFSAIQNLLPNNKKEDFLDSLRMILLPYVGLEEPKFNLIKFRPNIQDVTRTFEKYTIRVVSPKELCV